MFAPMTGLLLSEIILKETPTLPVEGLSLERFKHTTDFNIEQSVV